MRVTDIDLGDHMKNAVYWGVVEDHLSPTPEVLIAPLRVTIEHEAPIALGYAGGCSRREGNGIEGKSWNTSMRTSRRRTWSTSWARCPTCSTRMASPSTGSAA